MELAIDGGKPIREKMLLFGAPCFGDEEIAEVVDTMLLLDLTRLKTDRNQIISALLAENIGAALHFLPLHMHPYYREKYGYQPDDFPVARRVGESVLSLPLVPQMSDRDAQDVVDAVRKVVQAYGR